MSCGLQFWIIRQSSSVTVSCRWRIRQRPQTIENISRVSRQIFNMLKIWRRQNIRCDSVHVSLATATLISLTLTMPWKTVCSRYEVITDSHVFVGVRCQRLLTNKQREETTLPRMFHWQCTILSHWTLTSYISLTMVDFVQALTTDC